MNLSKVLIVFKKSTLEIQAHEHKDPRFLKLLEDGHTSVAKVKTAHDEHVETLRVIEDTFNKHNIAYRSVARANLDEKTDHYDLVVSVGGDGTFLDASHSLRTVPILGVNSAQSSSFGHFCLANKNNFREIIDSIVSGQLKSVRLMRLELELNGKILPELVLNEILLAHSNPAGTSRYIIRISNSEEEQRSSGIWIGPPAGSTGAIKSAGGKILPITDELFQYIVREPWTRPGQIFKHVSGTLKRDQFIYLISQMRTGTIFIDGQHIEYPFPLGDELKVQISNNDLIAYIDPEVNKVFS